MINRILLLTIIFAFSFCSESINDEIDSAAKVYVEFLIINETYPSESDSIEIKKKDILKEFNLSLDVYNKIISDLKDDKKEWDNFFSLSQEYLKNKKESLKTKDIGSSQEQF